MHEKPNIIQDALATATKLLETSNVDTPRLDAQLLLAWSLSASREALAMSPEGRIGSREAMIFWKAIELRCERRPLPYITGEAWFYGRSFKVNRAVLIPRPETEMIVEFVKSVARNGEPLRIADIGTGSGCIAVSIALEITDSIVDAVDISPLAINVADKNVRRYSVSERVKLLEGNLLQPLVSGEAYDLIVSNPPYIPLKERETLMAEVRQYEPEAALFGVDPGADTPNELRIAILEQALQRLKPGGVVLIELGHGQAEMAMVQATNAGYEDVEVRDDMAGIGRLLVAKKPLAT